MFIVKVWGGLGNQMFQYAFGLAKSHKYSIEYKIDITAFGEYKLRKFELAEVFPVKIEFASLDDIKKLKKVFMFPGKARFGKFGKLLDSHITENQFSFSNEIYNLTDEKYFDGYWQSPKYFEEFHEIIRNTFSFEEKHLSQKTLDYLKEINIETSISLHIRRGDYVSDKATNDTHGTCSLDYYKMCVSEILLKCPNAKFFIFSDDIEWAKSNLNFLADRTFIDSSLIKSDWEEMFLMSQCHHNILANSSFSWWGAWLNQNPNKIVIAPKQWFAKNEINTNDLIPPGWIRI